MELDLKKKYYIEFEPLGNGKFNKKVFKEDSDNKKIVIVNEKNTELSFNEWKIKPRACCLWSTCYLGIYKNGFETQNNFYFYNPLKSDFVKSIRNKIIGKLAEYYLDKATKESFQRQKDGIGRNYELGQTESFKKYCELRNKMRY